MFASMSGSNSPVGTIDELEVDHIPTSDDYEEGDDDATEFSQRSSFFPYNITNPPLSPTAGNIRMEGWLNHTTSSQKDHGQSSTATTPSPSSTTSILKQTVSKKKRQTMKKSPRYFVLRGGTLSYYSRRHDVKAKGTFVLTSGCTVGPVVYGSLDDPPSSTVVTGERQYQRVDSPSWAPENNSAPVSSATEHFSNKSKKKKRQYYCVQVTWPIDNKPSKDEKFMAQAKAQVAAESEKKAMIEKQSLEHTLDDYASTQKNGEKSPALAPRQMLQRSKSESNRSPRKSAQQQTPVSAFKSRSTRHTIGEMPEDLFTPDLDDPQDSDDMNGNGHPLLDGNDVRGSNKPKAMVTPAAALSGMNAFHHPNVSEPSHNVNKDSSNNSGSTGLSHETGLHKHYKNQIEKHSRDQQKSAEELQKVMQLISRKASHQKTKKKVIQGTKVAAVSGAAITAGVLTAGIGLAAGLVFVGITAAAGGSGAVVGSKVLDKARGKYNAHKSQLSFRLIIGAASYEEAMQWKSAMEVVIKELSEEADGEGEVGEEWRLKQVLSGGEEGATELSAPSSPKISTAIRTNSNISSENAVYIDMTPKWVPIQGGGMALWGILGALGGGGGNLRIYREERTGSPHPYSSAPWLFTQPATSAFPTIPRFRTDVGLVGQPFPPFKASIALKANSLDAFMCLMCSGRMQNDGEDFNNGRIPVPNSGQIASFRIIETMDDHMDVIHLVFRPLYLFPSWTAPRDFVLYRFWKFDDDGTYQICFDSGQHRDCPAVPGYVRGEMHGVYTIAPLKPKKKRGAGSSSAAAAKAQASSAPDRPNLTNEECLLSHVVQIDPRGWVPTTSSAPFLRNQGYGDAFAIMALHQMLDVKEALDSVRFVAVGPMDGTQHTSGLGVGSRRLRTPRRLKGSNIIGLPRPSRLARDTSGGSAVRGASGGSRQQQQLYVPMLENSGSGDLSDDENEANYDFKYSVRVQRDSYSVYSADGYHQSSPSSTRDIATLTGSESAKHDMVSNRSAGITSSSTISTTPPPTIADWWAEPDANSFRVRGKTYKTDSKKVNAGASLFRLFATDIVETDVPIMTGMCLHPKERVQLALQREREASANGSTSSLECPPFVFAVNIALPGPPNYHMVFYYAVDDMSLIDGSDGTPSSKLCQEFFFGDDDTFRDNTFKLIPQIIEGNFMVRKAVGSTPAIMGKQIKQTYIQGERFFELMIDTGSSAVAAGVIRICNGYAKMIVTDLAFLFEGKDESRLPERVLGTVRLKHVEFGKKLRFVESAED